MTTAPLTISARYHILVLAFLGWLCAGMHMSITQLTGQSAAIDLLERIGALDAVRFQDFNKQLQNKDQTLSPADRELWKAWKALVARWFAWFQCAFLFGAATGGLVLGWLGDRIGRSKGMAASMLTYSVFAAAASLAQAPMQLLMLWFVACMGVGGMWPNGVALVSEAWASMSRPLVAGVIGTSANIGIFLFASLAAEHPITPQAWRWVMLVGACPVVLALYALIALPESPRWLAARLAARADHAQETSMGDVFRPPLRTITLIGILLATVPMLGGWGSANWMVPWADSAGQAATPPNPYLKAYVTQARALTGIVGSLLGGWIASALGRRFTYFVVSTVSLAIAQFTFWCVLPTDPSFLFWVAALGFFSGIYFGWLPLFLPELFPLRVRSTGAGVSFNFGRILTAVTVFTAGALTAFFGGYAQIGRATSMLFILGMVGIWFAPDTSKRQLVD